MNKSSWYALLMCLPFLLLQSRLSSQNSDTKTLTMALAGDAIISRKLSVYQEPAFLKMIDLIRSADMAFANLEMLFHDYEHYPMHQGGGTYMRGDPDLANDLAWAGFDLISLANNHAGDYGVDGMRLTLKYVEQAGMVGAGVGESLMQAREAKFLETPNGRIAFISCSSSFPDHIRAGKSRGDMPARPGLNPIRYNTKYIVDRKHLTAMQELGRELGIYNGNADAKNMRFLGNNFEVGDQVGKITTPNEKDLKEIAAIVKSASKLADYTVVSIHSHESGRESSIPAQFLVTFSKAMIDAGADVIAGHGPHVLRGIEMYKGKPIFYSLNNFMFQNETLLRLPDENYARYGMDESQHLGDYNDRRSSNGTRGFPARRQVWESIIAMPYWKDSELLSLELHPITLQFGESVSVRGRPMLADEALGKKIIQDMADLSKPFGTQIEYKNGIGIIKIK